MANGNDEGWRKWTNHILFSVVMALCTGIIVLFLRFNSSTQELNTQLIVQKIEGVEKTMVKGDLEQNEKLTKIADKTEVLCSKVQEHDTLLRIPFQQRQDYFKFYKYDSKPPMGK